MFFWGEGFCFFLFFCFLNAVCRGKSADHWNTFVNLSSAGTLGDTGSDCSTLRLCLVYLLKCTVFKNQT